MSMQLIHIIGANPSLHSPGTYFTDGDYQLSRESPLESVQMEVMTILSDMIIGRSPKYSQNEKNGVLLPDLISLVISCNYDLSAAFDTIDHDTLLKLLFILVWHFSGICI